MGDSSPIVIDNGSGWIKAGMAGEDAPRIVLQSLVGRLKPSARDVIVGVDLGFKDSYVGDEALTRRGILNIKRPISKGLIYNWEDMEKIWHHIFYNDLEVAPEEHPVLMTEAPLNPKVNREKLTQVMFETFNTPAICLKMTAVLSLTAYGGTTGMVIESGDSITDCVPIVDGDAIPNAISRFDLGGFELTQYLQSILCQKNDEPILRELEVSKEIKENLCFVAANFNEEIKTNETSHHLETKYTLPDGRVISVDHERVQVPEAMFQPSFIGFECYGITGIIEKSMQKCDEQFRKDLYSNIFLSGGNTLFPGMADRFKEEITSIAPKDLKVSVKAPPERRFSAWIGGSLLASLSDFLEMCVSKQQYDEVGPSVVNEKCL